ncbi:MULTISPECIES: RNA polymerase sigma-70 factor [Proteiniphilum]|uniref:RNA polymerase sigma-70 factor n=1 Tax=Proteiniphilum TaxID=294702 RepID=UPI0003701DC3|nr:MULTISPECIES: RNA polymerase sigma-70 factor [Proteiniphilum]SFL45475.1 RNA polymerase sigma-70 factor, ECF subfamily [Porphyromonadaceae bacterium KH3CP3RA]
MKDRNKEIRLKSFRNYYETNVSQLILFARRFVSVEMAEDIIQDVFLDIWDYVGINEKLPSRSYLFTAVRNKCLNSLIRERVKKNYIQSTELDNRILGLDYYDSFEKQIIDREDMQYVYDEIEKLPEKCRVIFKMAYFEEKKNAEIAEILDISIRTVEHQLYLGLKTLRNRLTTDGGKSLFFLFFF